MPCITLPSLPDPILHLIGMYLTPNRPTVHDAEHGQSPTLYRTIINFSLTVHALNRISSTQMATNISLAYACNRWDLFLRSVQQSPVYASKVRYLELSDASEEDAHIERRHRDQGRLEDVTDMLKVLRGENKYTQGNQLLTGQLETLDICELHKIPRVSGVTGSTCHDVEDDGDEEGDMDWVDGQEEHDDDSDGWSERDYEYESEDSDWDSEDESDYEDDWEAEYGFHVPSAQPAKELPLPVPAPVVGLPAPGPSLLDF